MRKFKFMSKAVVGMMAVAMTVGSLSGVAYSQPMAVYAAANEVTVSYDDIEVTVGVASGDKMPIVENGSGYNIGYTKPTDFPAKYTFSTSDGKIVVPNDAEVAIPTTYKVPVGIVNSNVSESSDTVNINVDVTISVAQTDATLKFAAITPPTSLQVGQTMTPIEISVESGSASADVNSFKADASLPAGLEVKEGTDGDAGKWFLSGTPTAPVTGSTTIYLQALKADGTLLGWTPVVLPAVAAKENNGDGDEKKYFLDAYVDYDNMLLVVETNDPYFTVDVLKSDSEKEKPSKSYTYAGPYAEIDLGFLKVKKDNILNIYGSSVTKKDNGKIVKVTAQQDKLSKITVKASESSLASAIGIEEKDVGLYRYRSSFGSDWLELDNFDFTAAKVAGTTVVIRKTAVPNEEDSTKGLPASPEVKVKIPASPKAPKVTIDYVKDTVKVTDKMQIALLTGSEPIDEKTGWQDAGKNMSRTQIVEKLKSTAEAASIDLSEAFTIVVRTKGDGGKKSASMPAIVEIKEKPQLAYTDETKKTEVKCGNATLSAKKDKDGNVTFTAKDGDFQYDVSGKWKAIPSKAVKGLSGTVKVRLAPDKGEKNKPETASFASTELELTITEEKKEDDEGGTKFDKITIAAAENGEGYTAPTAADLVPGATTKALVFKYTATATKGTSTDAVTGVTFTWKVTAPTGVTIDATKWVWDQAEGTLTIATGTTLAAGKYSVTAESEGMTSTALEIEIKEVTSGGN